MLDDLVGQCKHKGPYKREAGAERARGDATTEAKIGMTQPRAGGL